MDNVHSQLLIMLSLPILVAKPGIGTIKSVFNVQTDGHSTQMEYVFQYLTTVENTTPLEHACHASKDMTSLMANVPSQLPITHNPPTSVARPGIGITKSASNVLTDGPSTQMESVYQYLTTAESTTPLEPVSHVTRDTT